MKIKNILIVCVLAMYGIFNQVQAQEEGNFVQSDLFKTMKEGDKAALLMVHFGTTHDDTRSLTIDVINQKAHEAFPALELREAYTSRIVMRRLAQRGIIKKNPVEALAQLLADGFTHVIIQSTNIIDGIEMESLRKDAASMAPFFKEIRIGTPLLYSPDDYKRVIEALVPKAADKSFTYLVGHGTYTPATAQYAMLDYMLQSDGHKDFLVGTIEGYPSFDDALKRMQTQPKVKRVQLLPFMFVAGDHAKNDIAGELKEKLEAKGYQVSVLLEGLGQNPLIQDIFIEHIRFVIKHKQLDIVDKKKIYASQKD